MKSYAREKAIHLRKQQWTYGEIARSLNVSKGSLSRWLRRIEYAPREDTLERISRIRTLDTGRTSGEQQASKAARVGIELTKAKSEIAVLGLAELRILGAMAYWVEGSKTVDSIVKFINTDPDLVRLMVRWLKEVCGVPVKRLRCHLRLHPGEDIQKTEKYWSGITGIPLNQFYRTTTKVSSSGEKSKRKLQWGIVSIIVCDTALFYRIKGWIDVLKTSFLQGGRPTVS